MHQAARLEDAQRVLDQALAIFTSSKEAVPVLLAGCESALTFAPCVPVLTNYAYVLHKNHRGLEA
jgi:hypothetical protein